MQVVRVESPSRDKLQTLVDLLRSLPDGRVIVFANHRESAERIHQAVVRAGLPAGLYHGGLDQNERENAIVLLANGTTPILISTDLGSRGLDIPELSAVIHYHMPVNEQAWTHRNGRTARQQAEGEVYVITSEGDDIPHYVTTDRDYAPTGRSANPIRSDRATLYFNVGKKEKSQRATSSATSSPRADSPPPRSATSPSATTPPSWPCPATRPPTSSAPSPPKKSRTPAPASP